MAVPLNEDEVSVNDDIQKLSLAQSYYIMAESAAYKDLTERLQSLVDQAQQEHFSSRETEPLKIVEEKLRWQQRLLTQQAIRAIVEGQLKIRHDIMEEINEGELNEYANSNA